jgi:hypothetical protein
MGETEGSTQEAELGTAASVAGREGGPKGAVRPVVGCWERAVALARLVALAHTLDS